MIEEYTDLNPKIEERFRANRLLDTAFLWGRYERFHPELELYDHSTRGFTMSEDEPVGTYIDLRDVFFLPKQDSDWIQDWVNFSTPEEVENQFAFYLGANYINKEEYELLLEALKLSRQIHGSEKRRDGIRRSLNGHILPGLRVIFNNRKAIVDSKDNREDKLSFFESVFVFMGHDWLEDVKDPFLKEKIENFPEELVTRIKKLTHRKEEGVSNEKYAQEINGAGRIEKFVKMIDRMVNLFDDIGKAPSLSEISSEFSLSRVQKYVAETRELYLEEFRREKLPLFEKFEQVVNYVEKDSKLSRGYIKIVRELVMGHLGLKNSPKTEGQTDGTGFRRERSPYKKLDHVERIIRDLEENSAKYGILPTAGMVGAIYFHDLVKDDNFINKMRSYLRTIKDSEPEVYRLLKYSLSIAHSSRMVENKCEIDRNLAGKVYSGMEDRLFETEEGSVSAKDLLLNVFTKPKEDSRKTTPRDTSQKVFKKYILEMYKIRPPLKETRINTFNKLIHGDIEGALLRALEVIDNIKNPPDFDDTYAWRNCQETLYLLLPLIETFGLKGVAKELKNTVLTHIFSVLKGKEFVDGGLRLIETVAGNPEIRKLEKIINQVVEGDALIDYDTKGIGALLEKLVEENRNTITDIRRCRVVLPPTESDEDLLFSAVGILGKVISQAKGSGMEISIYRPLERIGGEEPKKPIRISLGDGNAFIGEWADLLIGELKTKLQIPEMEDLHHFVPRKTGYKDVKIVFQVRSHDQNEPLYYEMIITDSTRHLRNTFGPAARVYKLMAKEIDDSTNPDGGHLETIRQLMQRSMAYIIYSHARLILSDKSSGWFNETFPVSSKNRGYRKDRDVIEDLNGVLTKRPEEVL